MLIPLRIFPIIDVCLHRLVVAKKASSRIHLATPYAPLQHFADVDYLSGHFSPPIQHTVQDVARGFINHGKYDGQEPPLLGRNEM